MKIYTGWIHGVLEDEQVLRLLGVELGPWNDDIKAWTPCTVTPQILDRMARMGDRFIWGMEVVEKEAP